MRLRTKRLLDFRPLQQPFGRHGSQKEAAGARGLPSSSRLPTVTKKLRVVRPLLDVGVRLQQLMQPDPR